MGNFEDPFYSEIFNNDNFKNEFKDETSKNNRFENFKQFKNKKIEISIPCCKCDKIVTFQVFEKDLDEFQNSTSNRNIQNIFPYLTPGQREMFITQICDNCWDKMFA